MISPYHFERQIIFIIYFIKKTMLLLLLIYKSLVTGETYFQGLVAAPWPEWACPIQKPTIVQE